MNVWLKVKLCQKKFLPFKSTIAVNDIDGIQIECTRKDI